MNTAREFIDMNADEVFELRMLLTKAESALAALKRTEPEMYQACTLDEDMVEQLKDARKKLVRSQAFTFDTFKSYKYHAQ